MNDWLNADPTDQPGNSALLFKITRNKLNKTEHKGCQNTPFENILSSGTKSAGTKLGW